MATTFERWEKDPFFAAAEEVQNSADRLESVYKKCVHERENVLKFAGGDRFSSGELERELHTVLGTAKWQLEELEHAVKLNDEALSAGEDVRARHGEFVSAIGNRILAIEDFIRETHQETGKNTLTWVRLDESERDELAKFLSSPTAKERKEIISSATNGNEWNGFATNNRETLIIHSKNPLEDGKVYAYPRSASCAGDLGACKITIRSEGEDTSEKSSDDRPNLPTPRVFSFSVLSNALDSKSKMPWCNYEFKNWTAQNQNDLIESVPLRNHELRREYNPYYERSKSNLSQYGQATYAKYLYGYLGAFQRLLQRSQYHVRYGYRVKLILWAIAAVSLIVIFILYANK
ncbi:uncharacterized protein LOC121981213 [Zingiber officinale]|uniref:uncharacterized protein LOC121981213 n=1 Tax=Zingiber officinale TaxID=94328 RepID=UPI001C4D894E|nr:uncharacterized protein LOC121981213 [Zingiber officinale]XP_042389571.1 uncharacterized protein LOC121981213 [Zingiber officinale]